MTTTKKPRKSTDPNALRLAGEALCCTAAARRVLAEGLQAVRSLPLREHIRQAAERLRLELPAA